MLISAWDLQVKTKGTNEWTVFSLNFWGVVSKSEGLTSPIYEARRIWWESFWKLQRSLGLWESSLCWYTTAYTEGCLGLTWYPWVLHPCSCEWQSLAGRGAKAEVLASCCYFSFIALLLRLADFPIKVIFFWKNILLSLNNEYKLIFGKLFPVLQGHLWPWFWRWGRE